MNLLVYLPLLVPVLAALGARPLAARLEPRLATWLLTAGAVALAGFSTAALALLAASALARLPFLATLGDYSQAALRRGDPVPAPAGIFAAALLTLAVAAAAVMILARARALAESYRRSARMAPGRQRFVVVPGHAIEAYALPGAPGRIVISRRLLAALDGRRRAVLLAHEQAHLSGRHHLFTSAAHLAAAANPLLLPVARAVDYTVERWADERAAAIIGDRRLVATTVGQVALLTAPAPHPTRAAALGIAGPSRIPIMRAIAPLRAIPFLRAIPALRAVARSSGTAATPRPVSLTWACPVPRRVAALLAPPPRRHLVLAGMIAILIVVAGASALQAANDLHGLVELAQAAR